MARKLRIQYPGAIYHVMSRGDHREEIFLDDEDRKRFLETLEEVCAKTDWQVHVKGSNQSLVHFWRLGADVEAASFVRRW